MNLTWHKAGNSDLGVLAEWNHQLIHDEGHRNPMSVEELEVRMQKWLVSEHTAIIFSDVDPVAFALFKTEDSSVHLRQLFVRRDRRSDGIGRAMVSILREQIWDREARITVEVLSTNPSAVAFYRSVGFCDYCLTMEINPQPNNEPIQSLRPTTENRRG